RDLGHARQDRRTRRLPVRTGIQPRLQARGGHAAGRGAQTPRAALTGTRRSAVRLYQRGHTQLAIAEELGLRRAHCESKGSAKARGQVLTIQHWRMPAAVRLMSRTSEAVLQKGFGVANIESYIVKT